MKRGKQRLDRCGSYCPSSSGARANHAGKPDADNMLDQHMLINNEDTNPIEVLEHTQVGLLLTLLSPTILFQKFRLQYRQHTVRTHCTAL